MILLISFIAEQNKTDLVRVGDRNVEASRKKLAELQIPVLAADTGATYGRTVIFYIRLSAPDSCAVRQHNMCQPSDFGNWVPDCNPNAGAKSQSSQSIRAVANL